jgi:hypothetical protein
MFEKNLSTLVLIAVIALLVFMLYYKNLPSRSDNEKKEGFQEKNKYDDVASNIDIKPELNTQKSNEDKYQDILL